MSRPKGSKNKTVKDDRSHTFVITTPMSVYLRYEADRKGFSRGVYLQRLMGIKGV